MTDCGTRRCSSAWRSSPRTNGTLCASVGSRTLKSMLMRPNPFEWRGLPSVGTTLEGGGSVLFDVERTTIAGRPALTVRGEVDISTSPRLAEAAESLLGTSPGAVVIDLTPTAFLDSSGARTLVALARRTAAAGIELHVRSEERRVGK